MTIHLYTVCWNVEGLLPYFIRHYEPLCDRLVFYDNMSTDSTRAIIERCDKASVVDFDTGGEIDQSNYLRIKNEKYKQSRGVADYVIVVDIDEFLYHPDLRAVLCRYRDEGVTLPKVTGFTMVSLFHPRAVRPLIEVVRRGRFSPQYSKMCVFAPELDINYLPGAHRCEPSPQGVESREAELRLLHYHYLGLWTVLRRYVYYQRRLSERNRREAYSVQYKQSLACTAARFMKNWVCAWRIL